MFHLYKSSVQALNHIKDITVLNGYEEAIQEIKKANQDIDLDGKFFLDIVNSFPELRVKKKSSYRAYNIFRNIVGLIYLHVQLGDQTLNFILDTGAQISCIKSSVLETNKHIVNSNRKMDIGDAFGTLKAMNIVYAERLSTLGLDIFNLPMLVIGEEQMPNNMLETVSIDGILGWDVLELIDFELDYKNQKIYLLDRKDLLTLNLIKSKFPSLLVRNCRNEISTFGIDTGAVKSWISVHLIEKCDLKIATTKSRIVYGVNGKVLQHIHLIKKMKIEVLDYEVTFNNIATGFTGLLGNYEFDGIIGLDVFRDYNIRFYNSSGVFFMVENNKA